MHDTRASTRGRGEQDAVRALRPRKRARLRLRDPSHELRQPRPIGAEIPRQADARLELDLARGRLHRLELRGQRPVGTGLHSRQAARLGQRHQELRQAAAPAAIRDVADPRVRPAGRERPDQLQRRAADWPGIGRRHRPLLVRILIEVALLGMFGPRALDVPADVHLSDRHQHGRHCDSAEAVAGEPLSASLHLARPHHADASLTRSTQRKTAESPAQRQVLGLRQLVPFAQLPLPHQLQHHALLPRGLTATTASLRLNDASEGCERRGRPANGSRPDLTRPRASGRMTFDVTDAPSKYRARRKRHLPTTRSPADLSA